jgi:hypothetical protein
MTKGADETQFPRLNTRLRYPGQRVVREAAGPLFAYPAAVLVWFGA